MGVVFLLCLYIEKSDRAAPASECTAQQRGDQPLSKSFLGPSNKQPLKFILCWITNPGLLSVKVRTFIPSSFPSPQQPSFVSGRCRLSVRALHWAQVTQNSKDGLISRRCRWENQTLWEIFSRGRHHQKRSICVLVVRLRD